MRIAAVGTALPDHCYEQGAIQAALGAVWRDHPGVVTRLDALCSRLRVERRCLALPLEEYARPRSFGELNDLWIEHAAALGERALRDALQRAGTPSADVGALYTTTITGIAAPSVDARIANRLGLSPRLTRVPLFGIGCAGGAAGIARAAHHVRGDPDGVAAVVAVELCSLTFQRDDHTTAHLIAAGLFSDGAAAVILHGAGRAADGPQVLATRSVLYPGTEDLMGWRVSERGFELVLSPGVPGLVREHLGPDVDAFLAEHGLTRREIGSWVCHPGGPKVLRAARDALGVSDRELELAWASLRRIGNLSSASVLFVLRDTIDHARPSAGTIGMILALGPGFCAELVLVRW